MASLDTSAPHNPALHQESLSQQARVIPPRERESLLHWLEASGRFDLHDTELSDNDKVAEELEDIIETSSYTLDKEEDDDAWDLED
jgi:hypothetical protein